MPRHLHPCLQPMVDALSHPHIKPNCFKSPPFPACCPQPAPVQHGDAAQEAVHDAHLLPHVAHVLADLRRNHLVGARAAKGHRGRGTGKSRRKQCCHSLAFDPKQPVVQQAAVPPHLSPPTPPTPPPTEPPSWTAGQCRRPHPGPAGGHTPPPACAAPSAQWQPRMLRCAARPAPCQSASVALQREAGEEGEVGLGACSE